MQHHVEVELSHFLPGAQNRLLRCDGKSGCGRGSVLLARMHELRHEASEAFGNVRGALNTPNWKPPLDLCDMGSNC